MIDLRGNGVLALWNGVDPDRIEEYDAWHTREHVPERISVPGMLGARRYVGATGPMPRYLTLYAMEDLAVLESAPYRRLLDNPTPWSAAMRPSFRGFMRLCCERLETAGGGAGGSLAALVVDEDVDLRERSLREALRGLLSLPEVTAVHVLERDRSVPDVPFTIGGDAPNFPRHGAILVEGYDDECLLAVLSGALADPGLAGAAKSLTTYRLAYALATESLPKLTLRSRDDYHASRRG